MPLALLSVCNYPFLCPFLFPFLGSVLYRLLLCPTHLVLLLHESILEMAGAGLLRCQMLPSIVETKTGGRMGRGRAYRYGTSKPSRKQQHNMEEEGESCHHGGRLRHFFTLIADRRIMGDRYGELTRPDEEQNEGKRRGWFGKIHVGYIFGLG